MELFFEQATEFTNSCFSAFEGEPFLTFLFISGAAVLAVGIIACIFAYNDTNPRDLWKKIVGTNEEEPKSKVETKPKYFDEETKALIQKVLENPETDEETIALIKKFINKEKL